MAKATQNKAAATPGTELAAAGGALAKRVALPQVDRVTGEEYLALAIASGAGDAGDIQEAIQDNLGGKPLKTFDFMRIAVPSGGGTMWEVPNVETAELENEKSIVGIIVAFQDKKSYWKQALSDAGAKKGPPDCYSEDAIQGIGDPGVACATCPNNQFKTAKGGAGKGKACKDWQALWIVREGDVMPILIGVPPKSLKGFAAYKRNLMMRGVSYWKAITEFTLVKDKNDDGIVFSRVEFRMVSAIDNDHSPFIKKYSEMIKSMMSYVPVAAKSAEDMVTAEDAGASVVGGEANDVGEVTAGNPFESEDRSSEV